MTAPRRLSGVKGKTLQLGDAHISIGDVVTVKLTIKKRIKKIDGVIKWRGELGKSFDPGIWYRMDVSGSRHLFQKQAIIENAAAKALQKNKSIPPASNIAENTKSDAEKPEQLQRQEWINIHFVGCPDLTKRSKQYKMHMSLTQSSTFEVAELEANDDDKKEVDELESNARAIIAPTSRVVAEEAPITPPAIPLVPMLPILPATRWSSAEEDGKDDEKEAVGADAADIMDMELPPMSDLAAIGDIGGLARLGSLGAMGAMSRGRSQSNPSPMIQHKKNKLSVNEIYSLQGVESRSIRIQINPKQYKVSGLIKHIKAKFQVPPRCNILLLYNNLTLSNKDAPIAHYGIANHSCLLLCISEIAPPGKPKPQQQDTSVRRNRARSGLSQRPQRPRVRNPSLVSRNANGNGNGNRAALSQSSSLATHVSGAADNSSSMREQVNQFCETFEVERISDLDIFTFDVDHYCLRMPKCAHGMPKETLLAYAESQFKDGQKTLRCPHLLNMSGNKLCKQPWPFQIVRQILLSGVSPKIEMNDELVLDATVMRKWYHSLFGLIVTGYLRQQGLLSNVHVSVVLKLYQYVLDKKLEAILRRPLIKRVMALEIACAKNRFVDSYDYQKCPNCSLFIYRKQVAMDRIKCFCQCPLCENKFCWACSDGWKAPVGAGAEHCGNPHCSVSSTRQHLILLQKCQTKTIGSVSGVPELRACIKCNELIYHETACKHMNCRSCNTQFCFVCLKPYRPNGGWQCGSYGSKCPIAPRQRIDAMKNTNRGNVELFSLE